MIITLLAGGCAVRHAAMDRATGTWELWGATTDYENAWNLLRYTGVSWQWLARKTRLFVALHWPEITRVAQALAERGVINSSDVEQLMEEEKRSWTRV
jgi:hypothetical protein